jgi:hypothetical protein
MSNIHFPIVTRSRVVRLLTVTRNRSVPTNRQVNHNSIGKVPSYSNNHPVEIVQSETSFQLYRLLIVLAPGLAMDHGAGDIVYEEHPTIQVETQNPLMTQ